MFRVGNISWLTIKELPNRFVIITGIAGMGKSFLLYRLIEEYIRLGRKVLIIDYSGSFTKKERDRADFSNSVKELDLSKEVFTIGISAKKCCEDYAEKARDSICKAYGISSYFQRSLLLNGLEYVIHEAGGSLRGLKGIFEQESMPRGHSSADIRRAAICLLEKLEPIICKDRIRISSQESTLLNVKENVVILQLSELPDKIKGPMVSMILQDYWDLKKEGVMRFDQVILDEFQMLKMDRDDVLSELLRQGRKYGIGMCLASQFLMGRSPEEIRTIKQAATQFLFRPTDEDVDTVSKLFGLTKEETKKLGCLPVGTAYLKGNYFIEDKLERQGTIKVCVEKSSEEQIPIIHMRGEK